MLFNSLTFVLFFVVVYALYLALTRKYQNRLLLAASYFFYGCWDWRFLSLIFISTITDYYVGLWLERARRRTARRLLLSLSLTANLGLLFAFKYFGFFSESLQRLAGTFGMTLDWRVTTFVLPVGISFYTFQTLSYTLDIYFGKLRPTRNFLDFAVFVAFFPQLVAGPIERATALLPQFEHKRTVTYAMVRDGFRLILLGYLKKVVLADNMTPFTEPIFADPHGAYGLSIVIAMYAAAFQIYGDFSGYSDIARGLAKLMGIELMVNFRRPYFATNPSEFWRRWHISLSTWLRDYLYIPLGGNRHGKSATHRNLMITMLLGGLWHGAAWHFVAWGLFHGVILSVHRMIGPALKRLRPADPLGGLIWRIVLTLIFFHLTCFGWLLFFAQSLADVPVLLHNIFSPLVFNGKTGLITILAFAGPIVFLDFVEEVSGRPDVIGRCPRPARLCWYTLIFAAVVLCGAVERHDFIYFQF